MQLSNQENSNQKTFSTSYLIILVLASLTVGTGCSIGALIVRGPTPTAFPRKTPKPTYTLTPYYTPTFTPTSTSTPTPTPTPTETPSPTPTEPPSEENSAPKPATKAPSEPVVPADTPTPEEPTATPAPAFPFSTVYFQHDTGSPGETRFTGWIRLDYGPGKFKSLANFQMKVVGPDGNEYLSEMSGPGAADSTVPGTGDNHLMNTKLEIRPYTAGTYRVILVEGGIQVSPEVEVTLGAEPRQYVHFDFFKQEE